LHRRLVKAAIAGRSFFLESELSSTSMTQNENHTLYIDGHWRPAASGDLVDVHNPATGVLISRVSAGGRDDAKVAIDAAAAAYPAWSTRTAYERAEILHGAWRILMDRQEELAQILTAEQGKPIRAARLEVKYAADFLIWFAEEAKRVYGRTIPSARADQRFLVMQQPIGVVAAITPWNYPISMVTRKVAPALAAGCTIVLKPAEDTPLCAIEVFKALELAGLPAGVANLVTTRDPAPIGEEFTRNPLIGKLTFTGSTTVGKTLARNASEHMLRVSMELGGHAPFIVFQDADPVHAAKGAALVKFLNTGQACISPNRFYVHTSIHDAFVDAFTDRVAKMRAGAGTEEGVSIGPLINQAAMDKMNAQVSDALGKGARATTGGERLTGEGMDAGYFFAPTVLTGITPNMQIYREETFGPIGAVCRFDDEDEVISAANDTRYGLAAYVYTRDLSRALRVSETLKFGIVGINDINPTSAAAPFGGVKESGLGREGAQEGILEYLETKLVGIRL
jgi:succinate-semialdehyde dehydrogenase/glutarate-semialdehyde dehydrogenase